MSQIALSGNLSGTGTLTVAAPNTNSDRTLTLPDSSGTMATQEYVGAANTTGSAASVSGTTTAAIAASALGSGTADTTTYLRGDRTWQAVSTTPTTAQVLSATAGATANSVGVYCVAVISSGSVAIGSTIAGSSLRAFDTSGFLSNPSFSGTWRNMGAGTAFPNNSSGYTLFLRIS